MQIPIEELVQIIGEQTIEIRALRNRIRILAEENEKMARQIGADMGEPT